MGNAVEVIDVTKNFKEVTAVNEVTLEVKEGELITLLGPSGCGKTTLLRIIAGFETPDKGRVFILGKESTNMSPEKRDVAMIFQNYALFPNMTVGQNIAFPMVIAKKPKDYIRKRVAELLDLVKLSGFENRKITQLSGGQKQRVALARALAKESKVLLLDEPLAALDAKVRVELRVEIKKIQQHTGTTMIYVTHDQEEALSISDRIAVMNHGVIQQIGTPLEIYSNPANPFVAHFVGIMNFLEGEISQDGRGFLWKDKVLPINLEETNKFRGRKVLWAIRPERIYLRNSPLEDSEFVNIEGKVNVINFLGSVVRIEVQISGDKEFIADVAPEEIGKLNLNEKIFVCFSSSIGKIFESSNRG